MKTVVSTILAARTNKLPIVIAAFVYSTGRVGASLTLLLLVALAVALARQLGFLLHLFDLLERDALDRHDLGLAEHLRRC